VTGSDPDSGGTPIDRTHAYRPDGTGSHPPLPPGTPKIPGITLHYELARGGMGVVYSGRQDFLDRRVAVKLLSLDLAGEKFAQRFRREAKILAGIKHPHIVACHSAGTTDDGQSYLVMEFVDGPSLKSWISEHGPMGTAQALRMTRSVAQALSHALQMGVIHRDVKPENILLESVTSTAIDLNFPYVPKLVDLGLARMTTEEANLGLTSPGSVMGTPTTMSPEQFDDPDSVDFRSDIYGLGCALYEALVGLAAFRGTKLTDIVVRKREPIGPNPCDENPRVPPAVGEFVCKLLASNRDERPASYRELDDLIVKLLSALPVDSRTPQDFGGMTAATIPGFKPMSTPPRGTAPPAQTARPSAPPNSPPSSPPGAPPGSPPSSPPGGPTGPGLLRTAELDFLGQGGTPAGSAPTAFRGGTQIVQPPAPGEPSAVAPTVVDGAPKKRRGMVIGVVAAVVGAAGLTMWAVSGGGEDKPGPRPGPNRAPIDVGILRAANQPVVLGMAISVKAVATDPDGDPLTYRWSGPPEVQFSDRQGQEVTVRVMDGLPEELIRIQVEVSDGVNEPVHDTEMLSLEELSFQKVLFLAGFTSSPQWTFDPPNEALVWTDLRGVPDISCNTKGVLRTVSTSMGYETFWKVEGKLKAGRSDNDPTVSKTAIRVELGDRGWSLVCTRTGEWGDTWLAELWEETREKGVWRPQPKGKRLQWEDPEGNEEPFAEVSIARRRNVLKLTWGNTTAAMSDSIEVPIDNERIAPRITLWVDKGRGEFRSFYKW
jgi:serine/threonine protein kinase